MRLTSDLQSAYALILLIAGGGLIAWGMSKL